MLNNIQIYHLKAEDPKINNTSIGKQMHTKEETNRLVGLVFHYQPDDCIFGSFTASLLLDWFHNKYFHLSCYPVNDNLPFTGVELIRYYCWDLSQSLNFSLCSMTLSLLVLVSAVTRFATIYWSLTDAISEEILCSELFLQWSWSRRGTVTYKCYQESLFEIHSSVSILM